MKLKLLGIITAVFLLGYLHLNTAFGFEKGIYLTQSMAENTKKLKYLIGRAKEVGIGTFVIDVEEVNKAYTRNIPIVREAGLRYVARLVIFPGGGLPEQVKSREYWEGRWKEAQYAINLGASAIQLDYIRYKPSNAPSEQNEKDIYQVVNFFKEKLKGSGITLQMDVFGIVAYKPAVEIGQNITLLSELVDALNPMVYPSHFEPHYMHSMTPYLTIYNAITKVKEKISAHPNVKVHAFIEAFNFRYPMSDEKRTKYIQAEMQAAREAGADGWYFWSAHNNYDLVFDVLKNYPIDTMHVDFRSGEELKQAELKGHRTVAQKKVIKQAFAEASTED